MVNLHVTALHPFHEKNLDVDVGDVCRKIAPCTVVANVSGYRQDS